MRSDYPEQKKEKKPNKVKAKATETVQTTGRVVKNAEQLVVAISLLIVTINAYQYTETITNQVWYYTSLLGVIVVGLMAFWQLVKYLNKG